MCNSIINPEYTEKIFPAEDEQLDDVLSFVESELEKRDCNIKTQMMITVIVEELFINIAHYAYPDGKGTATISMNFDNESVTIRFTDSGIEFNPLDMEDPDITADAEHRDIGGLGIYMTKTVMDYKNYERKDGKNIFTVSKRIH